MRGALPPTISCLHFALRKKKKTTFLVTLTRTPSLDIKRPEREGDHPPTISRED